MGRNGGGGGGFRGEGEAEGFTKQNVNVLGC